MKTNKYKILVLSDLKNSVSTTLKSTIALAKMIGAEIDLFHVKKATDVVENDNQLSAKRSINQEHFAIKKEISELTKALAKDYSVIINYAFSYGNVKHEIKNHIKSNPYDIIVVGKRKAKLLGIVGDNITNLILKEHKGVVMIASNDKVLEPDSEISLAMLNDEDKALNLDFADALIKNTKKPLKSFKIGKKSSNTADAGSNSDKVVEFVFEKADNSAEVLEKYLLKSGVNLLCINREKNPKKSKSMDMKPLIDKLNVPILVAAS